jgi:hypothetical protein
MYPFAHFAANYFQQYIPENNRDLVITFFIAFSRFEYALKEEGFSNGNLDYVSANWDRFATSIRGSFQPDRTPELQAAVNYLHDSPPRKQIVQGGTRLGWSPSRYPENTPLIHELLLSIRTVRNNLFHGAKFQEVFHEDHSSNRNQQLLQSSLIILEECLRLSTTVRRTFFAEIPPSFDTNNEEEIHG